MKSIREKLAGSFSHFMYVGRTLTWFFALTMLVSIFLGRGSAAIWIGAVFSGLLWPHLAFWLSQRSTQPNRAEFRNILVDSFLIGLWSALISFSLWPTVMFVIAVCVNNMAAGGFRCFFRGLAGIAVGAAIGAWLNDFQVVLEARFWSVVMSITGMSMFTLMFAYIAYTQTTTANRARKALREKNRQTEELASKLAKYLSPQIYQSIFTGTRDVDVSTHRRKLTIFFSDIKGFTELTDTMESEVIAELLHEYLDEMSAIALHYGGTIDKFIGDAVMIFFGDPETRGDRQDAIDCVTMALAMQRRMEELRVEWDRRGITKPLRIRIGINTGYCTVGNFGSKNRLDYTIIGGQVNLASRLESQAETNQILISEETYALVREQIVCRRRDEIRVKGIAHPVQTYEVVGLRAEEEQKGRHFDAEAEGLLVRVNYATVDKDELVAVINRVIKEGGWN